jgi:hypothetical protein
VDRAEARRRRRRKGHLRLAVAVAILVAVIVAIVLLLRGCGGAAGEPAGPRATATPGAAATADAAATPKPVSTKPPLVGPGDTVRFQTPDGAVIRVTVGDYADPGDPPPDATAEAGERLVTLKLSVTPEGAAKVPLPFEKADSFILVAEDDTLTVAQLGGDGLLGTTASPGKSVTTTLAFSVGASSPIRFVCTPVEGSVPRSATWELGD